MPVQSPRNKREREVFTRERSYERLKETGAFLLDLDGTFYLGEKVFPGSFQFLAILKKQQKRLVFVTNNSAHGGAFYVKKLHRLGVPVTGEQVFTSGEATIYYLQKQGFPSPVFIVGTPELEAEFAEAGYVSEKRNPAAVILGFDLTFTYEKFCLACDLVRKGIPFIATHPDLTCPTPEGPVPDCGALIAAVTAATGVKPRIIGKPYPEMVEALCARRGIRKAETAMIGDRLYTDVAMAQAAGILSILVLSGETQPEDLAGSAYRPDLIAADLGEVACWLAGD